MLVIDLDESIDVPITTNYIRSYERYNIIYHDKKLKNHRIGNWRSSFITWHQPEKQAIYCNPLTSMEVNEGSNSHSNQEWHPFQHQVGYHNLHKFLVS